ncbi:MAG: hypothetical protein H6Q89_3357 [Myxococcaceae bacterium]|nr:hypothetical protein [Myxococcaceae bacterium]
MPQKPLEWRHKQAKREGAARMLTVTDLTPVKGLSAHAAKKSRYVVIAFEEPDRSVGLRSPPEKGLSKLRKAQVERPAELAVTGRRRRHPADELEPQRLEKTTVRGRKKPPSQMHLKREGGPSKRSPLHGG